MSLDVFDRAQRWLENDERVALATVVQTGGSSPRPLGSKMTIASNGEFAGSVSGGCIEGAVIEEAQAILQGAAPKLLAYGIADEEAWAVGLSCGGEIHVFIEPIEARWFAPLHEAVKAEEEVRCFTVTGAITTQQQLVGYRGLATSEDSVAQFPKHQHTAQIDTRQAKALLDLPTGTHQHGSLEIFVEHLQPPPKLAIVGAVHIAEHLVHFANRLGFHTVVIDARAAFATPARFAHADRLLIGWPSEVLTTLPVRTSTYCAFLTHDPKFDDPAIEVALKQQARYVGALGSTRTHQKRCTRLLEAGIEQAQVDRIDAPIGLDLGGRKPEEIALAIAGRLIEVRALAQAGST